MDDQSFFHVGPGAETADILFAVPMLLSSWVQNGWMVLPVKSKCSRNVNTAMGMVPPVVGESGHLL